jgi:hypothetical protein
MFRFDGFSKSAAKASILIGAIAGSVFVASVFTSATSLESGNRQLDAPPTYAKNSEADLGAIVAIAAVSGVAIYLGVHATGNRNRPPSTRRSDANLSLHSSRGVSLDRASRSLQRQLLLLLHEDQGAAHRLFRQASLRYPGETPNWYADQACGRQRIERT